MYAYVLPCLQWMIMQCEETFKTYDYKTPGNEPSLEFVNFQIIVINGSMTLTLHVKYNRGKKAFA